MLDGRKMQESKEALVGIISLTEVDNKKILEFQFYPDNLEACNVFSGHIAQIRITKFYNNIHGLEKYSELVRNDNPPQEEEEEETRTCSMM
jgi:hypothetical protein